VFCTWHSLNYHNFMNFLMKSSVSDVSSQVVILVELQPPAGVNVTVYCTAVQQMDILPNGPSQNRAAGSKCNKFSCNIFVTLHSSRLILWLFYHNNMRHLISRFVDETLVDCVHCHYAFDMLLWTSNFYSLLVMCLCVHVYSVTWKCLLVWKIWDVYW